MLKLSFPLVVACYYFIFPLPVYAAEEVSFNLFTLLIRIIRWTGSVFIRT